MTSVRRVWVMLAIAPIAAGCTVDRVVPLERFSCEKGGPCRADSGVPPDGGIFIDSGFLDGRVYDALVNDEDADLPDNGEPDAGQVDSGIPNVPDPSCTFAMPEPLPASGVVQGNTFGRLDNTPSTCGPTALEDAMYYVVAPGRLSTFVASTERLDTDTVLYMFRNTCAFGSEVACNDDVDVNAGDYASRLEIPDLQAGVYYINVEGYESGPFLLDVSGTIAEGEQCDPMQGYFSCASGACAEESPGVFRCQPLNPCVMTGDCPSPPVVTCPTLPSAQVGATVNVQATANDDGEVIDQRWSVVSAPSPKFPPLEPPGVGDTAVVRVALAGEHRLRFTAIDDNLEAASCETSLVGDTGGALRVEVYWDAPGAPTMPVDVDLHLLDPMATRWFDPMLDCRPDTCTAGLPWAQTGPADDPVHEGDRFDSGPEALRILTPVMNEPYRIGVYYASDGDTFERVTAYVRIHCYGMLVQELGPTTLDLGEVGDPNLMNSFWKVADVVVGEGNCTVTPLLNGIGNPVIVDSNTASMGR
jgi:hypothetical protein